MATETRLREVADGWLLAPDLRDRTRLPDLHLAHHHIAAHRTWGCSTGLLVMAGEGELVVTPGAAVDRCGRVAVLSKEFRGRLDLGQQSVVVLRVRGRGPAGQVVLRAENAVQDLDVPLARVSAKGVVSDGDGDRQWLRRPGPARRVGGLVRRGDPVVGTYSGWTAHVDLEHHQLPDKPVAFAALAGPTPGAARTTVEVANLSSTGLDVVVRNHVDVGQVALGDVINTAPHGVSWLVLVPAERPELPPLEWT